MGEMLGNCSVKEKAKEIHIAMKHTNVIEIESLITRDLNPNLLCGNRHPSRLRHAGPIDAKKVRDSRPASKDSPMQKELFK